MGAEKEKADFTRLISPSIVKAITFKDLKQLSLQSAKKRKIFLTSLPTWQLQTAVSAMSFFRCMSHLYPYVGAILPQSDDGKLESLTLRFFGNETLPSTAVSFRLSS